MCIRASSNLRSTLSVRSERFWSPTPSLGAAAASAGLEIIGMTAESAEMEAAHLGRMVCSLIKSAGDLAQVASDGRVNADEINITEAAADDIIEKALRFKAEARRARIRIGGRGA